MEEENDFNFQENSSFDLVDNVFNTEEEEKLDDEEQSSIGPIALEVEQPRQIITMEPVEKIKPNVYDDNPFSRFLNQTNPKYNEQLNRGDFNTETTMVPTVVTIGDPKKNPFYIKTEEILKEISEIQKNPLTLPFATVSAGDQAQLGLVNKDNSLALDFKNVQAIDVSGTMNDIESKLEELPEILTPKESNYNELSAKVSVDKLNYDQFLAIQNYFIENIAGDPDKGVTEEDLDMFDDSNLTPFQKAKRDLLLDPAQKWMEDNPDDPSFESFERSELFKNKYQPKIEALAKSFDVGAGILPEGITQDMVDVYSALYENFKTEEEVNSFNESTLGFVKIPTESGVGAGYKNLDDLENLNENFKLNEEAFVYVREEILTQLPYSDYANFDDYVNAAVEFVPTLINNDPVNIFTITEANLNLQNEANVKYVELIKAAKADGSLNNPGRLEEINLEYEKWQEKRFASLLDSSDYEVRGLQYQYAAQKVLESIYTDFGRSKDPTFSKLDEGLKDGTYSEWWYKIRNTAAGSYTKWKQGMKNLIFTTPNASRQSTLYNGVATFNELQNDIKELGLGDMNEKEFMAWYDKNKFDNKNVKKYTEIKDKLLPLWDRRQYLELSSSQTLDELDKAYNTKFATNSKNLAENISANVEDNYRVSLIPQLGDDSSVLGLVNELIDQSNMIFMFAGMGLKQTKNPYAYAVGTVLDVLGSADIVAKTMTGDMWAVLDTKIKARKGEDYIPVTEDYMAELEDPDSINTLANVISTGAQFGMERFSLGKITKASTLSYQRVASLFRGQWKQYLATLPAFLTARELAGLSEYVVEGTQGLISDINQKLQGGKMSVFDAVSSGEFDFEGAKKGRRIAKALPVVGMITQQSAIELSQISASIAARFNQKGNAAAVELFYKDAISKIQLDIKNNVITEEQGNEQIEIISHYRNIGFKLPENLNGTNREAAIDLMVRKKKLQEYINKIDDKDITSAEIEELGNVSFALQNIILQAKDKDAYINQVGNVVDIINNNDKANVKIIRSKDDASVEVQIDKLKEEGWKIAASKGLTTNYGTIFQKGDQQVIILNDTQILEDGAINTAAHEFLHAVLWNTVRNSKGTAIALGNSLVEYLNKIDPKLIKDSGLADRIQQYKDDPNVTNEQQAEEVLTLFSEAVLDGAIDKSAFDGSYGQQIGEFFSRIFNSLMGRESDIKFNNGRDVYKFIKGYNKSIEKGEFTKAQNKLFEGRAEGDLIKREYTTKEMKDRDATSKQSKKLTELTNEYKAGNSDNVIDLTQQYQAAGRDALKRWAGQRGVPLNLSNPKINEEVTSLLNKQFPSFTKNFDSAKAEATTYLDNIAKRIGPELVKEATRQGTSLDSMKENVGFDVAGESQTDFDAPSQKSTARKKKYATSVPAIKNQISENVTSDLIGGVNKEGQTTGLAKDIVSNIGKNTDPETVAKSIIANTKNKSVMQTMRSLVGKWGTQEYNDFVDKIVNQGLIGTIPSSTIKRRLGRQSNIDSGLIKYKKTGTTDQIKVKDGKKTYSRPGVYEITNLNKEKLKEYYKSSEKRQQSLFSMITESIMAEGVQNLRSDKAFMDKLSDVLEIKKSPLTSSEFMDGLEQKLDQRTKEDTSLDTVTVKASKKYKRSAKIVEPTIKDYMSDKDLTMFAVKGQKFEHDKFTDDQIKARNESVLLTIPELGLDFYEFTNSTSGKTRSSDSFGASSGRTIFNFNAGNKIDELKDLLNAPLTGAFIEANPEYVKKYTKTIGNDKFLDKDKLKKGSSLSAKDITVLKKAESEQGQYAELSPEKRIELLRDKKFRDNQADKSKILKKILNVINKNVRKDGKIIPGRMEFWASWINSQVNNSKHVMRVLAPIEFFSLSKMPKRTFVEGYREVNGIVVSGYPLNYVAEHLMPANNAAKIAVDLIYNNTVNKDFSLIKDNYIQGQLLKTDDVIVGKAGYTSQFPSEFWNMDKPNVWVRYLLGNPNINLNEYVTYKDGKVMTIAESLGLPLDKSLRNPDSISFQNKLLKEILLENKSVKSAKAELKESQTVNIKSSKKVNVNQKTLFNLITPNSTTEASIEAMGNADKTVELGNKANKKRKGISVFDFDDTLAFSKSMVIVNMPDGTTTKISPAQFASEAELLEQNGAEFDFTEFEKVVKGRKGPLADLALKRQDKFGSGDIFVLTARPQASAVSIKKFLDGIGLNLPIENITGLANGSPDAKALWVLDKTAKGYNDFYFADDALANVQAVKNILDQVDVKSDVQLAKSSKKQRINKEFNVIIEQQSGKEWYKTYSDARAKVEGKAANRFEFFIPPSAEDFTGLLYKILPKGEKGNLAQRWIQDNLLDPFNKAEQLVIKAKIAVANDFQALREGIKNVPKNLSKPSGHSNFTFSQALRVHIWTMQGMDIPGLSTRDKNALNKLIENNPALKVFSEKIAFIQKGKEYPGPNADWVSGSITSDIINGIQKVYRKEALQEWQENVDIIFSKENMNKLEAIYGSNYVKALNNILSRMKRGSNRPVGGNAQVENVMDWLNNSVGAIMFLNRKSGLLQLISSVNFMNWSDNNPFKAGLAFANQKQYWKDVMYLLNSDYLVQRRNGLKINVAESEIAEASKKGGMKGVISYMLNKGFVFTRIADSLAISTGGASFYRNRVNSLLKQVNIDTGKTYTQAEAEAKAFDDFYQISEESQQSSRTDRISMQQASGLGRLVLNFANTPMQYSRIIKKATLDLLNGRGDWKTNLSKIFYYGAMQNLIFNAMQSAIFTTLFKEDDDEDKEGRGNDEKAMAIGQGMLSSLLRGLGYGGALVDTLLAISLEVGKQSKKKTPDFEEAVWSVFDYSPAIDSKIRKLRSAAQTYKYNRKEIYRRGFNLDNPAYLALGQVVSASTNIPADRALRLMMSLKQMSDKDLELWQRAMLSMGYSSWQAELPYWGTKTTLENEEKEDAQIKIDYKRKNTRLKKEGYKRRPMTKGIPDGELNVDYIRVVRPTGDYEYWLMPKK